MKPRWTVTRRLLVARDSRPELYATGFRARWTAEAYAFAADLYEVTTTGFNPRYRFDVHAAA
jgi:hypothetical protein